MNGGLVSVTTETLNQLYNYNWRTKRAHLLGSECMRDQRTVYVILKYALDTRECSHRVCCAHHARKMLALARQTTFSSNTHCQFNLAVHTNHICVKFSYSYGSLDGSRQPSQIISYKQIIFEKKCGNDAQGTPTGGVHRRWVTGWLVVQNIDVRAKKLGEV